MKSIGRRRFMQGSVACLGAAAVIGSPLSAYAQDSQTIKMAFAARGVGTIDPAQLTQGPDETAMNNIHDRLVDHPPGTFAASLDDMQPGLATSWEASPDSRTWTFKLRDGVQFHKGYGEFTADDVVFTYERMKTSSTRRVVYSNINSIEAVEPYVVVFHLEHPDPLFPMGALTHQTAGIVSRAAVGDKGENYGKDPIGTGPYQMDRLHADPSQGVFLLANPDHFNGPPATERIQIQYIPDATARTLALMSGEVQMIDGVRAPGWVQTLEAQSPGLIADVAAPGAFFGVHINLEYEPFQDIRVRQALFHAINREEIAQALAPIGFPIYGVVAPTYLGGFTKETLPEDIRYDGGPEKARELLAEAGYPDGISFDAFTSQREDFSAIMLIVQEQWRKAGIRMNLDIKDHTAYHAENNAGSNTLPQNTTVFPPDPAQPFLERLSSAAVVKQDGSGGTNFSRYGVLMPGIDEMLAEAQKATDLDTRLEIIGRMDHKVMQDAVYLPVVTTGSIRVRSPKLDLGFETVSGHAWAPLSAARLN